MTNNIAEKNSTVTDTDWKEKLTPEQYRILREGGTERAHTGKYNKFYEDGMYHCAGCGTRLFKSDVKFNSHSGWPSFTEAIEGSVREIRDTSHGMIRTEVRCANCDGHLGHVFPDGPREAGGMRFCINSAALEFDGEEGDDK